MAQRNAAAVPGATAVGPVDDAGGETFAGDAYHRTDGWCISARDESIVCLFFEVFDSFIFGFVFCSFGVCFSSCFVFLGFVGFLGETGKTRS